MTTVNSAMFDVPKYYGNTQTQAGAAQTTAATNNTQKGSIMETTAPPAQTAGDEVFGTNKCTDEKDDGKIGFWEGVGSFFKGMGKMVVNTLDSLNPFSKNFDPGKALLTVGAVALAVVCPPAGVAMACVGGAMAAGQIVNGIGRAAGATTDAEKKDALEDIGSGSLQLGLAVAGGKASAKAAGWTKGAGLKTNLGALKNSTAESLGNARTALGKAGNAAKGLKGATYKETMGNVGNSIKTNAVKGYQAVKNGNFAEGYELSKASGKGVVKSTYAGVKNSVGKAYTKINTAAENAGTVGYKPSTIKVPFTGKTIPVSASANAAAAPISYLAQDPNGTTFNTVAFQTQYTQTTPGQYHYDTSQIEIPTYGDLNGLQNNLNDASVNNFVLSNGQYPQYYAS